MTSLAHRSRAVPMTRSAATIAYYVLVEALREQGVDEVHSRGRDSHTNLTGTEIRGHPFTERKSPLVSS